jgi:hypothetical protein
MAATGWLVKQLSLLCGYKEQKLVSDLLGWIFADVNNRRSISHRTPTISVINGQRAIPEVTARETISLNLRRNLAQHMVKSWCGTGATRRRGRASRSKLR